MKKKTVALFVAGALALFLCGAEDACNNSSSSDEIQRKQSETLLAEGTSQVGMPAIKNFRERKILKDILELRDQDGLVTYTYLFAEQTGKLIYLGPSVGYGIPAATQFTNPEKVIYVGQGGVTTPQADPNGLFSPSSAEGTWVMLKDPNSNKTRPVYLEPRIIVVPFKLNLVDGVPVQGIELPAEKVK